jgi:hypothetical protein
MSGERKRVGGPESKPNTLRSRLEEYDEVSTFQAGMFMKTTGERFESDTASPFREGNPLREPKAQTHSKNEGATGDVIENKGRGKTECVARGV